MKDERSSKIENANRILFEKMTEVQNRKPDVQTLVTSTGKTSWSPERASKPIPRKADPKGLLHKAHVT